MIGELIRRHTLPFGFLSSPSARQIKCRVALEGRVSWELAPIIPGGDSVIPVLPRRPKSPALPGAAGGNPAGVFTF